MINLKTQILNIEEQERYILRNTTVSPVDYEEFIDELVAESTVTRHDVKAVVSALEEFIVRALKNGYTVRLGDLGSFRATITSTGQDSADDVSKDTITAIRVQFTEGTLVRQAFQIGTSAQSVKFQVVTED